MISNCGSDERGKYSGGKAGDQTGGEWRIRSWFDRPWNVVLRHPDAGVREELAVLGEKAAKNDLCGYDQNQRETYWQHLKASGYDPARITVACEADCSSGILANVKAAGYRLGREQLKNVDPNGYTGNERTILKQAGFQALTDSKYLTSDRYLLRGDILLYEGHHTATNLTDGANAGGSAPVKGNEIVQKGQIHARNFAAAGLVSDGIRGKETQKGGVKCVQRAINLDYKNPIAIDGVWGAASDAALKGHTVRRGETQYMVTALEILLMLKGYEPGGVENPGIFGAGLTAAVKKYQKEHSLTQDGIAGYHTYKSLMA